MKKNNTFLSLIIFYLFGLFISISAQQINNVQNLSAQTPTISGGAESSILIEKMKKMGNTSLQYIGSKSIVAPKTAYGPTAVTAITPIEGINF